MARTHPTTLRNNESYFEWLCDRIDCRGRKNYGSILRYLYSTLFYSLIPNDDNRGLDGLNLRGLFEVETDTILTSDDMTAPCNLLEMLIALAERMAFIIFDPGRDSEPNIVSCFWQLIFNLGLKPLGKQNEQLVSDFLERNYTPSGDGGLFPLGGAREDQQHIEVWYQMMAYIEERYL